MSLNGEEPEFLDMDKLIVQNSMVVHFSENTNLLQSVFSKLQKCSLQYVRIISQRFSANEYDFLTSGGKIMRLVFQNVTIIDEIGEPIIFQNLLYKLPLALYIDAPIKTRTNDETQTMLFNWDKPTKLHVFIFLMNDTLMEILQPIFLECF